jgi:RNA polymerase sigma-70 factor (ECF subfamily)
MFKRRLFSGERTILASDEELMILAAQGDMKAFEQIVLRYQASVWRTACRFSGDSEEARDIAQSVFLKLFESAPSYRQTASFKTFLFRIVNNTCIDSFRKKRPEPRSDLPDVADESPSQAENMAVFERKKAVRGAIRSLPPRQRSVIILRYDAELSVRDIAGIMRVSEKAVERLLAHAREALHSTLRNI